MQERSSKLTTKLDGMFYSHIFHSSHLQGFQTRSRKKQDTRSLTSESQRTQTDVQTPLIDISVTCCIYTNQQAHLGTSCSWYPFLRITHNTSLHMNRTLWQHRHINLPFQINLIIQQSGFVLCRPSLVISHPPSFAMRTNVLALGFFELRSLVLTVGDCVLFLFGAKRRHKSIPIFGD